MMRLLKLCLQPKINSISIAKTLYNMFTQKRNIVGININVTTGSWGGGRQDFTKKLMTNSATCGCTLRNGPVSTLMAPSYYKLQWFSRGCCVLRHRRRGVIMEWNKPLGERIMIIHSSLCFPSLIKSKNPLEKFTL